MSLKQLYVDYDLAFTQAWNEYIELHKKLDTYRGKELTDEIVLEVNPLIVAIQDKFQELHPCIHSVIERYQLCARAMQEYNEFIEHIKQGGAVTEDEAKA